MSKETLIENLRGYKSTPRHCEELCYEAANEIESLRQQLAECQAALAAKDEALEGISCNLGTGKLRSISEAIADRALDIQPSDQALREWGARLLEVVSNCAYVTNTGYIEVRYIRGIIASKLRSGEWKPFEGETK